MMTVQITTPAREKGAAGRGGAATALAAGALVASTAPPARAAAPGTV